MLGLLFAFLSPLSYALMNVLDKYVVSRKVRDEMGYLIPVGIAHLLFGCIGFLFTEVELLTVAVAWPSIVTGVGASLATYAYIRLLKREDASNIIGLLYIYPIGIAILSALFLQERLTPLGYVGMIIACAGAVLFSLRWKRLRSQVLLLMVVIIFFTMVDEFLVKVATTVVSEITGIALTFFASGASLIVLGIWKQQKTSWENICLLRYAFPIELMTFAGLGSLYAAMAVLPATVVASIGTMQPLAVLGFEEIYHRMVPKKSLVQMHWRQKIVPMLLVIVGVMLVMLQETS